MKLLDFLRKYSYIDCFFSKRYIDFYQYELEILSIESYINEIEYKKEAILATMKKEETTDCES